MRSTLLLSCFCAVNLLAAIGCDDGADDGKGGASSTSQSTSATMTATSGSTTGTAGSSTGSSMGNTWSLETGAFLVDLQTANDGGLYVLGSGVVADLGTKVPVMPDVTGPGYLAKLSATTGAVEWSYVLPGITPGPGRMVTSPTGHVAVDGHDTMSGIAVSLDASGKEAWKQTSNGFGWTFPDFDVQEQVWAIQSRVSATGIATHLSPVGLWGAQVAEANLVYFGTATMGGPPELRAFQLDGTTPVFSKTATFTACVDCHPDLLAAALTTGETVLRTAVVDPSGDLDPAGKVDWGCGQTGNAVLTAFDAAGDCLWSIPSPELQPGRSIEPSAGATFIVAAPHAVELRSAADGSIVESWDYPSVGFNASASPYHPAVHVMEFVQGVRTLRRLQ